MYKIRLKKPDERYLILYGQRPISGTLEAPSPNSAPVNAQPHFRWHPMRGEWVAYASHRQNRTFLPPPEYNPLAVSRTPEAPTELPVGDYDIAVFENLFPTMTEQAAATPDLYVPTVAGRGVCEVVVYSQDPNTSLARMPLSQVELLLDVWADRYQELGQLDSVRYIMPFENRGVEVGVTLQHPHGQIYAYPFVPPIPLQTLERERQFYEKQGKGLLEDMISKEVSDRVRIISQVESAISFIPVCARYPYEVWVTPKRRVPSLVELSKPERSELARTLKTVLLKYDQLWNRPFPYVMVLHQAPTDDAQHPHTHLRFELYPPYRAPNKLKYLAGSEIGCGVYVNDALPEERAKELRETEVHFE